jgi:hypothetical protein
VRHIFTCYYIAVNTQNITLKLPSDALKRAKVAAAHRGTSLSALLAEKLEQALGEEAEYDAARKRAFKWLDAGWHLGGHAVARDLLRG